MVTRLQAGAGGVALRGALALDPERYEATIIAGDTDGVADADGSGDRLLVHAAAAGLRVVSLPELVSPISPRQDTRCLHLLTEHLARCGYDVVHTHSAKAGALGRLAAERAGHAPRGAHVPWLPVPRVPVPGPPGRPTSASSVTSDGAPTCSWPSAERSRPRRCGGASPAPERVRVINPAIELARRSRPARRPGTPRARRLGVPVGCKVVGTVGRVDYQKAPESFVDAIGRAGPAGRVRGLDRGRPAAPRHGAAGGPPGPAGPLHLRRASRRRAAACCPGSMCSSWPAGTKACPVRSPRR